VIRPEARADPQPQPIEPRRARTVLIGLAVFAIGFAVAAVCVLAGAGGSPPYLVAITVGMLGIGLVGFALPRQARVPMPAAPLWSPTTLRFLGRSAGLPELVVPVAFYALVGFGVLGNLVIPLASR
jgi:hypothetical protein